MLQLPMKAILKKVVPLTTLLLSLKLVLLSPLAHASGAKDKKKCVVWLEEEKTDAPIAVVDNHEVDTAHDLPANDPSAVNLHLKNEVSQISVALGGVNSQINDNIAVSFKKIEENFEKRSVKSLITAESSTKILAVHADRRIPIKENGPTFVNSDAEYRGISDRKYGYCWGVSTLTRNLQTLAFYDATMPKLKKTSDYFKLIDKIVAGNATLIPGYANLREFTLEPEVELYMKLTSMELWKADAAHLRSIGILHTATTQATKPEIEQVVVQLEERLKRNQFPKIVFSSLVPSREILGLNTDIHVVLVYNVERLANGGIRVHIWDIDFYAETLIREPKFLDIDPNGLIHYQPWHEPDASYSAQSDLISRFRLTPENDAETAYMIQSLKKFCKKNPSRCVSK